MRKVCMMNDDHVFAPTPPGPFSPDLLAALAEPFAPWQVELRVGKREQRGAQWFCQAVPVVPRHFYEDRLNRLVPGRWCTTTPSLVVAAGRLVIAAQVQIDAMVHTDYGERPLQAQTSLNELSMAAPHAQAAFEQAFVGACARFGLGRFLADLGRPWVPYDSHHRRIRLSTQEQADLIEGLYRQAHLPLTPRQPASVPSPAPRVPRSARVPRATRPRPRPGSALALVPLLPVYPGWPLPEPDRARRSAIQRESAPTLFPLPDVS